MSKDMVEPKRKYIDVESTWKKQLLNKAAGPGGLLIVTMVQARDLRCFLDLACVGNTATAECVQRPLAKKESCQRTLGSQGF